MLQIDAGCHVVSLYAGSSMNAACYPLQLYGRPPSPDELAAISSHQCAICQDEFTRPLLLPCQVYYVILSMLGDSFSVVLVFSIYFVRTVCSNGLTDRIHVHYVGLP